MLLQIEMDYRIHNPLHVLPVVGAMPRYFVAAVNSIDRYPVTLNPFTTTTRFPIIAVRGIAPKLVFQTYSLVPGASFDVSAVRVSTVPITQGNYGWFFNVLQQEAAKPPLRAGFDSVGIYKWR